MNDSDDQEFFPIRRVTEQTGVGSSTLRAWERRYGLLKPMRTPKGHRLYSQRDVVLVRRVLELLEDGHAISEVARRLLNGDQKAEPRFLDSLSVDDPGVVGQWQGYMDRLVRSVEAFSPQRLDAVYNEASSLYPLDLVSRNLLEPALRLLGDRWRTRDIGIAEEHFFTAWLRNKLGARLHHESSRSSGVNVILACLPGNRHELGLLLFSLAALGRGYRVVYLGPDMPLEPLPEVVRRCGARAIILAGGREGNIGSAIAGLLNLVERVDCPVFMGGSICHVAEDALNDAGVTPIGDQFALALHLVASRLPAHGNIRDGRESGF